MTGIGKLGEAKLMPITDVRPAERNPRRIPPTAVDIVAKSLQRFGWQQPLVVDKNNVLIAGHTRLLASKQLGLTEVPVIVAEQLTPAEADAFRIADNRTHDFTMWDFPELVQQLDELAEDFGDVLALADWEAITTEFDELVNVDAPDEVLTDMTGKGFAITLIFETEEQALTAEAGFAELPGLLDIRHKRKS